MGTWIIMLLTSLLVPGIVMVFGNQFKNGNHGSINPAFGYRTTMSMKNPDTWTFANTCWGRLACKTGLWMLIGSVAVMLTVIFAGEDTVALVGTILLLVQAAIVLCTIPIVERALRKEFDKDGNRLAK